MYSHSDVGDESCRSGRVGLERRPAHCFGGMVVWGAKKGDVIADRGRIYSMCGHGRHGIKEASYVRGENRSGSDLSKI